VRTLSREAWHRQPVRTVWQARTLLGAAWRLVRFVRDKKIDFIQSNTLKTHVLGALVARLSGRPLVWHLHDIPSTRGDTRALLDAAARLSPPHGILAVSRAAAADLPSGLRGRVHVLHNGLDLKAFDRASEETLPHEAWMNRTGPVLGAVSYLIPWKGLDILLEAMPAILAVQPRTQLIIAGAPIFQWQAEPQRLRQLAEALHVAGQVHFLGERDDVPALLRHIDVFVHPARFEPFGRVLLEAMAARKAVVACAAGGVPEVVLSGETGTLVPPGDPQALAEAILALLQAPSTRQALGDAGRSRVAEQFTLKRLQTQLYEAWSHWGLVSD
jgi:glycosyltransferase involved in cell wall biosynthesis